MIKKLLIALGIFGFIGIAHAATVFNSNQLGTGAASGTFLETNGVTSTWAGVPAAGVTTGTVATLGSPLTISGVQTSTITGDGTASNIENVNNILYVPSNFAAVGCNGSSTLTDFGGCVDALYASASSTNGVTIVATANVSGANWKTPINFNINGVIPSFDCTAGVRLIYGGTGTAVTFNFGNPTAHLVSSDYGCIYQGNPTLIAAGQSSTATTTGIAFGGGTGAVDIDFYDNTINGFGHDITTGANAYMLTIRNNSITGGANNATGSLMYVAPANNSGERFLVTQNVFADPANSSSNNAIYIADNGSTGALSDGYWINNSFDDAEIYFGIDASLEDVEQNHFENPAYTTYLMKYFILASSSGATTLNVTDNEFQLDNTGATGKLTNGIEEAVNLTFDNNDVNNTGGGSAITNFIDHTINAGQAVESVANNWSQNNAVTNWVQLMGTPYPSNCFEDTNGYPFCISANSNGGLFLVQNSTVASVGSSGNWNFKGNVSLGGTLTATSTSVSYIGNIDTTAYIPTNYATVGCASSSTATDFGACVNAIYQSYFGVASSVNIIAPNLQASFSTGINFNNNGERALLEGNSGGGTTLTFTNTSTAAIKLNYGIQAAGILHEKGEGIQNITLIGMVATTTQPLNVGIEMGGQNGDAGTVLDGVNVMGFDKNIENASNSYNIDIENSVSRNGGYIYYADGTGEGVSNSGESINLISDFFVDGANNIASNTFYLATSSISSMYINGGSIDDAGVYDGAGNLSLTMTGVHLENPGYSAWGSYPYIVEAYSGATSITQIGGAMLADSAASSTNPPEFILYGGYYTAQGVTAYNVGGAVVPYFMQRISGSANYGTACNILNGNNAFTTLNYAGGAFSAIGCYYNNSGSYTSNMPITAGNVINISNENGTTMSGDATGDWTLGINGGGTLTNMGAGVFGGGVTATGTVASIGASSTVSAGVISNVSHGCFELYDSVNTSTKEYIYTVNNILTATTTNPGFCK